MGRLFKEAQLAAAGGLLLRLSFESLVNLAEFDICVTEKDEAKDGGRVFVRAQAGVSPHFVGGAPEVGSQLGVVDGHLVLPGLV